MIHRSREAIAPAIFVLQHNYPQKSAVCSHAATHDYAALLLYTKGAAVVEQRSRWSVKAGEVLLIPAGEPHRTLSFDEVSILGLGLSPASLAAYGGAEILAPFTRVRAGGAAVISLSKERQQFLEGLLRELQRELALPTPSPSMQHSLLTLIAGTLSRAETPSRQEKPPGLAAEALQFIEQHCLRPISLREVADAVHRSPAYLTTMLRKETGKSVHEWITAGRLQEVRRRLETTDEKLDTIAERVGYADSTHLIRLFRRAYGLTPAAWRATQSTHRVSKARQ
jgi:AraC family transcriptional regulator, transcriptional activator of pobA